MEKQIKDFIKNNKLTFAPGRRNKDSVVLSGYALHLGMTNSDELEALICKYCKESGDFETEFRKTYNYASNNNYGSYWDTEEAKENYIF